MSQRRERYLSDEVKDISLLHFIKNDPKTSEANLELIRKRETDGLTRKESQKLINFLKSAEKQILKTVDVVVCTCVTAGDRRLQGFKFRTVLIDESSQAKEPETLIPIVHGCQQLILVGDHRQLRPTVQCQEAESEGLSRSLFERLVMLGHKPIRLTVQYRMHPCMSLFPSNKFYEGELQDGITSQMRARSEIQFPWPVPHIPMFFWASTGQEKCETPGRYTNKVEAEKCRKLIRRLMKDGVAPSEIAIITPYAGQREYLTEYFTVNSLDSEKLKEVEINSVDGFQGREKNYIIVSLVRSNRSNKIGFLSDPRRLNVVLTRAKHGLVMLGNPKSLSTDPLWSHLLNHFHNSGCLVEGNLSNLLKCTMKLTTHDDVNKGKPVEKQTSPRKRGQVQKRNENSPFSPTIL